MFKFELCCSFLLEVRITVVPKIDSSTLCEKQVLKSLLPLAFGDLFDRFNLALSTVKHVAVVGNLGPPVP